MLQYNKRNASFLSHLGAQGSLGQAVYDLSFQKDFYVVSADLGVASGFSRFSVKYPEKFINVGIAEQSLVSVAAGLSNKGIPVIGTSWGAFASYRCADQVRIFMGLMQSNIKLVGMGSGLAIPRFGGSHYGIGDIALMRSIPGIDVITPSDGIEIYRAIDVAMRNDRPTYIRLTGGDYLPIINDPSNYYFEIGKANILKKGEDVLIVGCGNLLHECLEVEKVLQNYGITATIINMHTIKPLDQETLLSNLHHKLIVSVEEHNIIGGLGSAIAEVLAEVENRPRQIILGISDFVPKAGDYRYLLDCCNLSVEKIADRIMKELER